MTNVSKNDDYVPYIKKFYSLDPVIVLTLSKKYSVKKNLLKQIK